MSGVKIRDYTEWSRWVVPRGLRHKPVHRWFVFPHSFTDELVDALIEEWSLGTDDLVIDPFVGAGTTLVTAKGRGVPAWGGDLSPLSVLASSVKVARLDQGELSATWERLRGKIHVVQRDNGIAAYPELVQQALPGPLLPTLDETKRIFAEELGRSAIGKFFQLALLRILPDFSRAVPTGGWLSWRLSGRRVVSFSAALSTSVEEMIADVPSFHGRRNPWRAQNADARRLPLPTESCSAVITSPPYPNRHDYTRVFGVELMFGFMDWNETRRLRYQLFHSHPEARPSRPRAPEYEEPRSISQAIRKIERAGERDRLPRMLRGYFLDTYLFLREVYRVLRPGGNVAVVVGNAQYRGVPLLVDRAVANLGVLAGLTPLEIRLVRERGNSAQQMGKYGRVASRESVVVLQR